MLRGNVQAELEALAGELIVTPALPVEGRTVRNGILHVHGVPQATPIAVLDAETDEDLDAIVAAAPPHATLVGSAGLAAALGRRLGATPLPRPTPRDVPLLVGVGTRAADEQVKRLRGVEVIRGTADEVARRVAAAPHTDLVLTGGETARRTLDALGVTTLEPIAQIHHGAVQCRTPGRPPRRHPAGRFRRSGQPGRDRRSMPIAVTMGDGAGIGPEIVVAALNDTDLETVVIGDRKRLEQAARILDTEPPRNIIDLDLLPEDLPWGEVSAQSPVRPPTATSSARRSSRWQ